MNASLFFDLMLTVLLSTALVAGGAVTLWLLPWTDADRAGTERALRGAARRVAEVARPGDPLRYAPAR